jgi:DNA polymerase I
MNNTEDKIVVCDIEANGLNPDRIWIIVAKDLHTDELHIFDTEEDIHTKFPEFAKTVDYWVGHNFLGYDRFVLNELIKGVNIETKNVVDTLVMSRLANPVRPEHNLEYWGTLLGYQKQEHEDWTRYSEEMKTRCITDVELNTRLYPVLCKELKDFSEKSIRLEHEIATILELQRRKGFLLDIPKAQVLYEKLKARSEELMSQMLNDFAPIRQFVRNMKPRYNASGKMHGQDSKTLANNVHEELSDGTYNIYEMIEFNPNSPSQIVARMNEAGWKPIEPTKSGKSWKVNETNLATLPEDAPDSCKNFVEFRICESRWKIVKEWLDHALEGVNGNPPDGRVHGSMKNIGANTHRMSHFAPNMGNLPSVRAKYGYECRSFLTTPDSLMLCGCDASGIQLRVLAHYMNDPEFTHAVAYGDPHTKNMEAAGLETRAQAKTFIYAWLLGAGDAKIGSIIGGSSRDGRDIKKQFLDRTPALARVVKEANYNAMKGYMIGLDGRRLPIKSAHYALSSYLQGGESVIMKYATFLWHKAMMDKNLMIDRKYHDQVAFVHDEWQTEIRKPTVKETYLIDLSHAPEKDRDDLAEAWTHPNGKVWSVPHKVSDTHYKSMYSTVGELQVKALRKAGEFLELNCPIDGEYSIGNNWAETH